MTTSKGIARTQYTSGNPAGGAGSLVGSISLFASQGNLQAINLSTEGLVDWFATINSLSGAAGGSLICKGGTSFAGLLRKSFVLIGLNANFGPQGGSGLTMHSDATDSAGAPQIAVNSFEAIGSGNNPMLNYGFEIEAPASKTTVRNLNLYIPAINGNVGNSVTFGLIARLSDDSGEVDLSQTQIDFNEAVVSVYKANFQFKSANAGAKLRVQGFVTGVTGTPQFVTFGLQCATLF
jgi:hypothetical protein